MIIACHRMVVLAATHRHLPESELSATTLKKLPALQVKGKTVPVETFAVAWAS